MAIPVTCRDCGASYQVGDQLDGKKVRCKECDAVLLVDSEAPPRRAAARPAKPRRAEESRIRSSSPERPERPQRLRRDRDDDDDDAPRRFKKKQSGVPLALILCGVGAAILLLLGGVVLVVILALRTSASIPATPVATVTVAPLPMPVQPNQDPNQNPQPAPNPFAQPNPFPPANPLFPPPAIPAPQQAAPLTAWQVQPDPLPAELAPPDNPKGTIPVAGLVRLVLYPSSSSSFVAVAGKVGFMEDREVWNLKTMKRFGAGIPIAPSMNAALSADGAYMAAPAFVGGKTAVDVWNVANGKNGKIIVDEKPGAPPEVDFAGPDQVLTAKHQQNEVQVQVWNVKNGTEVRSFKAASRAERRQWAFSAGRKYLALFGNTYDRIMVFDLTTGRPAGDLAFAANFQFQGMGFSPDGKSFAALFGMGQSSRLQIWDVVTGQSTGEHTLENVPQNTYSYEGQAVEWLQDGGLMLFGQWLVDPKSGGVYWKIPTDAADNAARRFFGSGCVAYVKGEAFKKSLLFEALAADRIAAARKATGEGQDPDSAAMPAVQAADWAKVKELPAPAGVVEWKAVADTAPAAKGMLGKTPIPLTGKAADIQRILFSRPDVGQAAVLSVPEAAGLSARLQVRVERYDLSDGKHLGGADLFEAEFPKEIPGRPQSRALDADLSPDGTLLAVREPKTGKRIDVWSMAEGKHLVGWLPYEKEGDSRVHWFAFLDAKHLLTVGGVGKLTLWEIPECKAIYSIAFVRDLPALSAGRKYLTAFTGSNFEVLEAATGERVGQLFRPNTQGVQATAYSPDGRELAAVLTTAEGLRLARWDAVTGAVKDEFAVPPGGNELEWCGSDNLLFGSTLYDINLKWPVALYGLPGTGRSATSSPDGRHWFAAAANPNNPPLLTAQTLPDAATRQLATQAAGGKARVVLAPGMAVKVVVQGAAPGADAEAFHRDIASRQNQHLQALGFKTVADGPLTLTLQIQPARDTGQKRPYKSIGRLGQDIEVNVIEVTAVATLTDAGGTIVWTQKNISQPPFVASVNGAESMQQAIDNSVWKMASAWAGAVAPPSVLIRIGAGVEGLPRSVALTGDH
jgi:hypothetical protein